MKIFITLFLILRGAKIYFRLKSWFLFKFCVAVTSMPAGNELDSELFATTEKCELTSLDYESVDSLNKLPYETLPSGGYTADFDDSTDEYDGNFYAMESEKLKVI